MSPLDPCLRGQVFEHEPPWGRSQRGHGVDIVVRQSTAEGIDDDRRRRGAGPTGMPAAHRDSREPLHGTVGIEAGRHGRQCRGLVDP